LRAPHAQSSAHRLSRLVLAQLYFYLSAFHKTFRNIMMGEGFASGWTDLLSLACSSSLLTLPCLTCFVLLSAAVAFIQALINRGDFSISARADKLVTPVLVSGTTRLV